MDIKCDNCGINFYKKPSKIKLSLHHYCCRKCQDEHKTKLNTIKITCPTCGNFVKRNKSQYIKSKSGNIFCNASCAAFYNNTHKTKGNRRSKLEIYLEKELNNKYSNIQIIYNDKSTILSELDIFIPSLNLAIELNGIFHYEPIYGESKLKSIQNNDNRKFQACIEKGIELCIIDTSSLKYFKPINAEKYLNIITTLIDLKLSEIKA